MRREQGSRRGEGKKGLVGVGEKEPAGREPEWGREGDRRRGARRRRREDGAATDRDPAAPTAAYWCEVEDNLTSGTRVEVRGF